MVYAVVLLGIFVFLVDRVGVRSVVLAYVAAHVSHAVLHYVLARRALGFRIGRDNRLLLGGSLALLAFLAVLRPSTLLESALAGVASVAWALLS